MKLIIGLGNPGKKYENTRHNIGFIIIDQFAKVNDIMFSLNAKFNAFIGHARWDNEKYIVLKPATYMNLSGDAVRKVMDYYQIDIDDVIVVVDDINIPLGKLRFRELGGHGGHNGLRHIEAVLGSNQYKRIRVGIGLDDSIPLDHFVLSTFSNQEKQILQSSINAVVIALEMFIKKTPYKDIMTRFNTQT